eukprot:g36930.t1
MTLFLMGYVSSTVPAMGMMFILGYLLVSYYHDGCVACACLCVRMYAGGLVHMYHNVGILVLFLHDVNDILLEFTKLNVYFKNRAGVRHKLNDVVSNIGCCSFAISWFWFRLYWFPLKVLYATCYSSLQSVPNIPFYFFFNILLLILTLMNIYWFM